MLLRTSWQLCLQGVIGGCIGRGWGIFSPFSEQLVDDRVQEGHVFCALYRELVDRVVLYHLGDAGERVAELAQNEAALARRDDLHVHEAAGTPAKETTTSDPSTRYSREHEIRN